MPDPGRSEDRRSLENGRGQTPARRADGPSACPGDSSHERGRVGASDNPWDMQQAEKSIRVRNAGEDLLPRPGSAQRSSALGWTTARVPSRKRHAGCPHPNHAGAAGAVFRPVVPHAPTGKKEQEDRRALGPDETRGDDASSCSPDKRSAIRESLELAPAFRFAHAGFCNGPWLVNPFFASSTRRALASVRDRRCGRRLMECIERTGRSNLRKRGCEPTSRMAA